MKTRTNIVAATILAVMLLPSYAVSVENNITQDLLLLPYVVSGEKKITKEFSTPPYVVSKEQKIRRELAIITSFAFIDYNQSVAMFYGPGGYYELNPILGSNPSKNAMFTFGVAGIGIFYILANSLSDPWRQLFVDSIIASELRNIEDNRRIYQGWNTDGPPIRGRSINGIPIIICIRF